VRTTDSFYGLWWSLWRVTSGWVQSGRQSAGEGEQGAAEMTDQPKPSITGSPLLDSILISRAKLMQPEMITDDRADHPFPVWAREERCNSCNAPAAHKIEETTDIPFHPLTAYLCCGCFKDVMGMMHDAYPYQWEKQ
jgi:hypothetical protein